VQRRFTRKLAWPLFGLFCLGGLQGLVGWWMVSSGLEKLTSVSQYRLAAHLTTALVLFLALVWVARRLQPVEGKLQRRSETTPSWPLVVLMGLVILQIAAGAFVAGLHAGFQYNTWPLMDGGIIPAGLGRLSPWWRNVFEDPLTVQFNHRMIAYAIFALTAWLFWRQAGAGGFKGVDRWMVRLMILVLVQVALGIVTLLSVVPLDLAVAHQTMAFILAGSVIAYLADRSLLLR
jgi:cytochrome c oxidase assembly protein subunit 15